MKLLFFFIVILLLSACKKEKSPDVLVPETPKPKYKVEILTGNEQNGIINQELANPITIKVTNPNGILYSQSKISFITSDGQLLFRNGPYLSGTYTIYWMLGCKEGTQNAVIIISDSAEKPIDTLQVSANAQKDTPWNRVCGLPVKIESPYFYLSNIRKIIEHPDGTLYSLLVSYSDYLIYSSTDNGETWNEMCNCTAYMHVHDLMVNENGNFFLSTDKGLFKSTDSKTWKKVLDGFINNCISIDDQTLYACDYLFKTIYRSDDKGETWNNTPISHINEQNANWYSEGIRQVKRIDNNRILLLDENKDMLFSKDDGANWELFTNTNQFLDKTGFILKDNYIYLVDQTGAEAITKVYKSDYTNVSWSLLCTLSYTPHIYYEVCEISSFSDDLYFLTSNCIFKVNQYGSALNVTKNIWEKMGSINMFLISKQGVFLVGSGNSEGKSIFRNKWLQP